MESLLEQMKAVVANAESERAVSSLKRKREQTEEEESLKARVAKLTQSVERWKDTCTWIERKRDDAILVRDNAIREKDDAIRQRDNALDTKCLLCEEERCFMGKICANDCKHRCCILCMIDLGFNNHHSCPWCRGELSSEALLDLRRVDRKLRTPAFLSRPTTPRHTVQDSLHFIMQGQLPELTPQQVSRRLDDLFAQAPTTVTEMFEAALPPAPETPAANVSGSNTTVVNGTTYYFDD